MGEHCSLTALYQCNVYDIMLFIFKVYVTLIFILCCLHAIFNPTPLTKIRFIWTASWRHREGPLRSQMVTRSHRLRGQDKAHVLEG